MARRRTLATRNVQIARDAGALAVLTLVLDLLALVRIFDGNLGAAAGLIDEADTIAEATATAPWCSQDRCSLGVAATRHMHWR